MKEVERKFRVSSDYPRVNPAKMEQGYLWDGFCVIRVRTCIFSFGKKTAFLTFKGKTKGISRKEFEFSLPFFLGRLFLFFIKKKIIKTRYHYDYEGKTWEIDEFHGDNKGLVIAEVELKSEDEQFYIPRFCLNEVSFDFKYLNSNLIKFPYKNWET